MQGHRSPASDVEPTSFILTFNRGDAAHLAAGELELSGFRAVVTWVPNGTWEVAAGALASRARSSTVVAMLERAADCYDGRYAGARPGWRAGHLEQIETA